MIVHSELIFRARDRKDIFTNEHLSPGLYKLAVNCFENGYHTQFIISKMLGGIIIQTIVIVLIFIASAYIGNREIIRMFFELSLLQFLSKINQSSLFLFTYDRGTRSVQIPFNDLMKFGFENKTAEALRDILEYETALSWAIYAAEF
ncbi:MAG: hypothetical protein WDO19_20190 [Bacteroidota bacterium]